ncbi:unnamed protein product [Penicillium salamii]|uniref:Zn(2)-C6 fungal-type domain-containing protein n=1 Tax=Penicillium salamii TaxID=1612424 RepID=A0A9W4J9H9_9EURO|nr:unnamed protein product [Penicillium salamii]CAG8384241.1 unnamed protein product [Penicillium salamii]CAG8386401.1 unnamed protein product [Penicillium salamii]CAG8401079.1 unnamed protein product [Penicillium salamii]
MTSKKQKKAHSLSGGDEAPRNESAPERSGLHSAPPATQRPGFDLSSDAGGRASNSAPALGGGSPFPTSKVAIPRQPPGPTQRYSRRVPRACESCRQRKTKCSGDTPVCRQCRELRVACQYPMGWREKMKQDVDRLAGEVQEYEKFLHDLRSAAESTTAHWVNVLLEKYDLKGDVNDNSSLPPTSQNGLDGNQASPLSSIGSLDAIDRVDEDHNRTENSRATGYMGKSSEITWIQRLQREAEQRSHGKCGSLEPRPDEDQETKEKFSLHVLNYHLDDLSISVPEPVQEYSMPPRDQADHLLATYLETVHPFFPIVSKPLFNAQFRSFFESSTQFRGIRPGDKWLAILNMIFAIAAKHADLTNAQWHGSGTDHLIYLARARRLSMSSQDLFSHPDLQQVQVEGLIAFYLLSTNQINRAWRISALAVRSAITLGLNLRNNNSITPNVSKESRYKVWWCIYSLEHMLGIMTGRPSSTLDGGSATPLPLPFDEDQLKTDPTAMEMLNNPQLRESRIRNVMASSWDRAQGATRDNTLPSDQYWVKGLPATFGVCYLYYCDLTVITQEVLHKVYSTHCVLLPWAEIESRIDELRSRFDLWRSNLPSSLEFTERADYDSPDLLRCKLLLGFHYYSSRITLGRPCLCRRDARQNGSSPTFSHTMALITLDSATCMINLISDEPNVLQLYEMCPWWCILRQLMQAAVVILLELSFGSVHIPEDEPKFVRLVKKCIRWFFAMPEPSAQRAWRLCDSIFRKLAQGMKYNTNDIPHHSSPRYHPSSLSAPPMASHPSPEILQDYFNLQPEDMTLFGSHPAAEAPLWTSFLSHPTTGLTSSVQDPVAPADPYLPYDPLGDDFIRAFFAAPGDGSRDNP